jgi:hypothetical protein
LLLNGVVVLCQQGPPPSGACWLGGGVEAPLTTPSAPGDRSTPFGKEATRRFDRSYSVFCCPQGHSPLKPAPRVVGFACRLLSRRVAGNNNIVRGKALIPAGFAGLRRLHRYCWEAMGGGAVVPAVKRRVSRFRQGGQRGRSGRVEGLAFQTPTRPPLLWTA